MKSSLQFLPFAIEAFKKDSKYRNSPNLKPQVEKERGEQPVGYKHKI